MAAFQVGCGAWEIDYLLWNLVILFAEVYVLFETDLPDCVEGDYFGEAGDLYFGARTIGEHSLLAFFLYHKIVL